MPSLKRSGPPVHDGPDQLHPEVWQQLNALDDWIPDKATGMSGSLVHDESADTNATRGVEGGIGPIHGDWADAPEGPR